jgi:hypothetical protein
MVAVLFALALCSFAVMGLFVTGLTIHTRLTALRQCVEEAARRRDGDVRPGAPVSGGPGGADAARRAYNEAVTRYNAACGSFPASLIARVTGLHPVDPAAGGSGRR